jgi:hypothetical protein
MIITAACVVGALATVVRAVFDWLRYRRDQ